MRRKRARSSRPLPDVAEGSRRVEAALREQQRLLRAAGARLKSAGRADIHHGRVAARRLRSLLKTFRPLLDARRARRMRADLRRFARSLAAVREADVRRDLLLALSRRDAGVAPADFQRLSVILDDLCLEARASLRRHVAEPGWAALNAAIGADAVIDQLHLRRDASLADVLQLANDAWRKAARLLEAGPTGTAELHELRLALKHCRYALESVADVHPKEVDRLLRRLRVAQDRIGEHRDAFLADQWVRLNERSLGWHLSRRLLRLLEQKEGSLRRQAADRARKVLPAYEQWRRASRPIRKAAKRDRG
jgi:CHAD domain-containing protein